MDEPEFQVLNEYYSIPLHHLHVVKSKDIEDAVTVRPRNFERDLMAELCPSDGPVSISWDKLLSIADRLENEIARTLSSRHVFFWQHLYRRLFPTVIGSDGEQADEVTTQLVRSICEAAIAKHGALTGYSGLSDISRTDIEKVFGGWLAKCARDFAPSPDHAEHYLRSIQRDSQLVIVDFDPNDLVNLYYAEGLCFQYWKTTARLRSVGKGAMLVAYHDGSADYVPDDRLRRLFTSYDLRAATFSSADSSALGIWYEGAAEASSSILCLVPNAEKSDLGPLLKKFGLDLHSPQGNEFIANFVPGFIDGDEFVSSHQYIADAFQEKKGFSIKAAVALLHIVSALTLSQHSKKHAEVVGTEMARAYSLFALCKRGYVAMTAKQGDELRSRLKSHLLRNGFGAAEINCLLAALTLTEDARQRISLWSRGPQFVFLRYEGAMLLDFNGIIELLHNLFVGVRDDAHARGMKFEENIRSSLTVRGVAMEQRNFKFQDKTKAEADAVFYKDGKLIVADCFSMWRPLDFEISRPKTVANRQAALEAKIKHAVKRSAKLDKQRIGRNFDFSTAVEIITVVVTPMVEWLWDESQLLWLKPGVPRVMQANEFIHWACDE